MNPNDACASCWREKWNATLDREARWIEKLTEAESERDRLRAKLDDWAAQRDYVERAEQAEGQCEAVSKECIRLQETLAAEREAHSAHLAKHKTADSHDCAEMEEEYQRKRAEVERLRADYAALLATDAEIQADQIRKTAEVARLREALVNIAEGAGASERDPLLKAMARAALAPEVKRHDWSCASDCECNFKAAKGE